MVSLEKAIKRLYLEILKNGNNPSVIDRKYTWPYSYTPINPYYYIVYVGKNPEDIMLEDNIANVTYDSHFPSQWENI